MYSPSAEMAIDITALVMVPLQSGILRSLPKK